MGDVIQERGDRSSQDYSERKPQDSSQTPGVERIDIDWSRSDISRKELLKKMKLMEYLMNLNTLKGNLDNKGRLGG